MDGYPAVLAGGWKCSPGTKSATAQNLSLIALALNLILSNKDNNLLHIMLSPRGMISDS